MEFKTDVNLVNRFLKGSNSKLSTLTIEKDKLEKFKNRINKFHSEIKRGERSNQSEFNNFLRDCGFTDTTTDEQEDKTNFDLTISSREWVRTVFELKKPGSGEFYSDKNKFNVKGLWEILINYKLYNNNHQIDYHILSDFDSFYLIEKKDLIAIWSKDSFKNYWKEFKKGSKHKNEFYRDAPVLVEGLDFTLSLYRIQVSDYLGFDAKKSASDRKLTELYKFFSPYFLISKEIPSQGNTINKKFYTRLLEILGLKQTGKLIKRFPEKERSEGSLIEATITQLQARRCLSKMKSMEYGRDEDEQLESLAIQLILIWVNRILFLKLLESQLLQYNNGEEKFKFLSYSKIKQFDDLEKLFLQILAIPEVDRRESLKEEYGHIPYLNTSLFELDDIEDKTFSISNLDDDIYLDNTKTLKVLLDFLDSFDFRQSNADIVVQNNDSLINSSILGRVFEKINGYKDGSYFTPSFITEYMCRTSIRHCIVAKFNEKYDLKFKSYNDLIQDTNRFDNFRSDLEDIVNSLKICDPAVGSGHFLVSALNEIIVIKHDHGILKYKNGKTISKHEYNIYINDDELIVKADTDINYHINPQTGKVNKHIHEVQKALFHEKKRIIEDSLFGVDINPNSVNICRLRLWIELLKNSYYLDPNNPVELETLPNIDINIKCGNSLVSRFDVNESLLTILKDTGIKISEYKEKISLYKTTNDKSVKERIEEDIKIIQNKFKGGFTDRKFKVELSQLRGKIGQIEVELSSRISFGDENDLTEKERSKLNIQLNVDISKLKEKEEERVNYINDGGLYSNAFEWRYMFPEILNDDGDFIGFDVVIGNPPWGAKVIDSEKTFMRGKFLSKKGEIETYNYFVECAVKTISSSSSIINLLLPNSITFLPKHKPLRDLLLEELFVLQIIELEKKIFCDAPDIIPVSVLLQKNESQEKTLWYAETKKLKSTIVPNSLYDDSIFRVNSVNQQLWKTHKHSIYNLTLNETYLRILNKVANENDQISQHFTVKYGIKIGGTKDPNKYNNIRSSDGNWMKCLKNATQISKFKSQWNGYYINWQKGLISGFTKSTDFDKPKLLIQYIRKLSLKDRLIAALDLEGLIPANNFSYIQSQTDSHDDLYFLLGILNSSLINFYFTHVFIDYNIKPTYLKELPFPFRTEESVKLELIGLVKSQINDFKLDTDLRINKIVYTIFGINKSEKIAIERFQKL